jgi:hypothetical protein
MTFSLSDVVPWGRNFDEYVAMFSLTDTDLKGRILGCGDGPASFNAEATRRGLSIVSVDPIYQFSAAEIQSRIAATSKVIAEQLAQNADDYVWTTFPTISRLVETRLTAMRSFIADFPAGKAAERYVAASAISLPFSNSQFTLALCSHFLFLYSEHCDAEFHLNAIVELCRVADEVRIFPLLELGLTPSRHLAFVTRELEKRQMHAERVRVPYEFQQGGNEMLKIMSR